MDAKNQEAGALCTEADVHAYIRCVCQEEQLGEGAAERVVPQMVAVHQSARAAGARFQEQLRRPLFVTPKNYLDFVAAYRAQLAAHRARLADTAARLDGGLQRLVQARPYRSEACLMPIAHLHASTATHTVYGW